MVYADSSLITSCYINDAMTQQALSAVRAITTPMIFTLLHRLELRNATKLAVFRGRITQTESATAWSDLLADYRAGKFVRTQLKWSHVFRAADKLASAHSIALGTRSLDILHVAAARELDVKTFLTFDKRQRDLALAVGLQVLP